MKVLVVYDRSEAKLLKALDWHLRQRGIQASVTHRTYSITELAALASKIGAAAVVCCQLDTLRNLVGDPKPSLSNWRGSRINTETPTIVIDSLRNIYAVAHGSFLLGIDLDKVVSIRKKPAKFDFTLLDSRAKLEAFKVACNEAWAIGLDIETNQWNQRVKSSRKPCHNEELQIDGLGETFITIVSYTLVDKNLNLVNYVLPLVNGFIDYWKSDSDYALALEALRVSCECPAIKIMQNGQYDTFHLIRYRCFVNNWVVDSMGLMHAWYAELPKDLGFISSVFLYDHYYWKWLADAEHKAKDGDFRSYCEYGARDTWAMVRAVFQMVRTRPAWVDTNYAMSMPLVYPSLQGALEGFSINNDTRKRLLNSAEDRMETNLKDFRTMAADDSLNLNSSKQVSEFLYDVLGAVKPGRAKSKSATDAESRKSIALQHPLIAMFTDRLDRYSTDSKATSTYFQFLQYKERLLFSLDPFGTDTFRFASRSSALWVGTQIQNQPYYAKEMYEPDEGYLLFELDYSKAEAVCTAHLSQCVKLIKALVDPELDKDGNPKDFYKVLGELFFNMAYEDVTDFFRNKVLKRIQHGTNYMMGAGTFIAGLDDISILYEAAEALGLILSPNPKAKNEMTPPAFAKKLLDSYHDPFPEVREWWNAIRDEVATTGKLVSPSGHTRIFFGDPKKEHGVWRSAVAHQPQNLSVHNLNKGYLRAYQYNLTLEDRSALRLKTQVHDSIVGQVKIEYAAHILPLLMDIVKAEQVIHGRTMNINVEAEVSTNNWGSMKPWETFLKTTLPTLGNQKCPTYTTDG